jgi:murein L,D-transpeptidase YafK
MKTAVITTLCIASTMGAITWYGFKHYPLMKPADHFSTLSKQEYAQGRLREKDVIKRMTPRMTRELSSKGLEIGARVFLRIFKEDHELEMWVENKDTKKYDHFKTWKIAAMSGDLGPKLAEGDFQAPEGFYYVARSQMNPGSNYHLAFNIGYPNSYDRAHARTGSFIMIHGSRYSAGCFAMTDPFIEEIYTLCAKALANGQPYFRVHIFPFRMTSERMAKEHDHRWSDYWSNLKAGYDWFEQKKTPPDVSVKEKKYVFR